MKITFPHLGNTVYAAKALFDGLGIDYIIPPASNKEALEIGTLYSPEEICLPFKIMLGGYIQSIEKGADTIIITGSCGPCRFGEFCELQMKLLKRLGYNVNFIVVDYPKDIGTKEFVSRIMKIANASSLSSSKKIMAAITAKKIIDAVDEVEKIAKYNCGYEKNKGEIKKLLNQCKCEAFDFNNPHEMLRHFKKYKKIIEDVPLDKSRRPIKIALIGEIYTVIEPFSNGYIEDKLMDYGICVKRHLSPSWWVKNAVMSPFKLNSIDIRSASRKYLPFYIGGHARECIGEAELAVHERFDGAIQLMPMGCMPEVVAKSILPSISRDNNFPIMTLIMDEMTGDAGYNTRIEAFIDLLERRKNTDVLSWC